MATTPILSPFSVFDANENYAIEFFGDLSSDVFNIFFSVFINTDIGEEILTEDNIKIIDEDINDYISNYTNNTISMVYYGYNYYLIIPQRTLRNGNSYTLQLQFLDKDNNIYNLDIMSFKCYSKPIIELTKCEYQDGTKAEIANPIIIEKTSCKLSFAYTQNEGDALKYYQFFLYGNDSDGNEKLLGNSNKFYSQSEIEYTIENYNNQKYYTLKLYCITQSGTEEWYDVNVYINYNQNNVYANLLLNFDNQTATNNVLVKITQLTGEGEEYDYTELGDSVVIADNGYVSFTDQYQSISSSFLCKMWCTNLSKNVPFLKIATTDGSGYIEVFFRGMEFIAKKYSCNLVTTYMCHIENPLNMSVDELQMANIYFAFGYFDGRIEMYATTL